MPGHGYKTGPFSRAANSDAGFGACAIDVFSAQSSAQLGNGLSRSVVPSAMDLRAPTDIKNVVVDLW